MKVKIAFSIVLVMVLSFSTAHLWADEVPVEMTLPTSLQPGPISQFQPRLEEPLVVWTEYQLSTEGIGEGNIILYDAKTNRSQLIAGNAATDSGLIDRLNPDISNNVIVWEDSRHTCPACPHDIFAYDLTTGREFPIAVGPADETTPSISGTRVVWRSYDGKRHALLGQDLATGERFEIASHPADGRFFYGRPVIDGSIVVWSEYEGNPKSQPHTIYALNLVTGQRVTVARVWYPGSEYDISGHRIAWTGPLVTLYDIDTGQSRVLFQGWQAHAPAIQGDLVVWADGRNYDYTGFDIYGYDLRFDRPFLVSAAPGNESEPDIDGEQVVWQQEQDGVFRIVSLDLAGQRPEVPPLLPPNPAPSGPINTNLAEAGEATIDASVLGNFFKGMHGANGDGWGVALPKSTDAIVNSSGVPYFNYHTVLNSDLWRQTGYPSPRGPTVGDLYRTIRVTYSKYVVVRLWPTLGPDRYLSNNPEDVAQQYISLASSQDWVNMVQTNNEPNVEWAVSCSSCRWEQYPGGPIRTYSWSGLFDYRLYQAINTWYQDVWYRVSYWRSNHPNPTIRTRLQNMTRYTPPMADIYRNLDNGQNFYTYLQSMIDLYDYFTYHVYPWPEFDAVNGYIKNNSWPWFTSWLQSQINSGAVWSRITEFGWNPGQMDRTGKTQRSSVWGNDGRWHTFCPDVQGFINNERHNAYGVMVFLVQSTDPALAKHDGLDDSGNPYYWFSCYRSW